MKIWIAYDDELREGVGVYSTREEAEKSSWEYLEIFNAGTNLIDKELGLEEYSISVFEGKLANG